MKKFSLLILVVFLLGLVSCPLPDWSLSRARIYQVPTPYIYLSKGNLEKEAILNFSCDTTGKGIGSIRYYYTIDGTIPNRGSASANYYVVSQDSGELNINLIAVAENHIDSEVYEGRFCLGTLFKPSSISFNESTIYMQKGESASLNLNVTPTEATNEVSVSVTKNGSDSNGIVFDNSLVQANRAGIYTITASYKGIMEESVTVYVWEYRNISWVNPDKLYGTSSDSTIGEENFPVGNGWQFYHSSGTAKNPPIRVYLNKSSALDDYFDYQGNPVGDAYGYFVDRIGGADFNGSLLKIESLPPGFYAIEGQFAGNATLIAGDQLSFKIGTESVSITTFNSNWRGSNRHISDFYEVVNQSDVQYGYTISTKVNSGVWGFAHSIKIRQIPKN